ncbi:MAG TPA: PKD domain-containing protein [Candidatus Moranbacteria bacterium]|nr:PKD domain-containing protein [Candidatus Moranbacteria bacterium]
MKIIKKISRIYVSLGIFFVLVALGLFTFSSSVFAEVTCGAGERCIESCNTCRQISGNSVLSDGYYVGGEVNAICKTPKKGSTECTAKACDWSATGLFERPVNNVNPTKVGECTSGKSGVDSYGIALDTLDFSASSSNIKLGENITFTWNWHTTIKGNDYCGFENKPGCPYYDSRRPEGSVHTVPLHGCNGNSEDKIYTPTSAGNFSCTFQCGDGWVGEMRPIKSKTVRFTVSGGSNDSSGSSNATNAIPTAKILSPANGTIVNAGDFVVFQGKGTDDGMISGYYWTDETGLPLGQGSNKYSTKAKFTKAGEHTINLKVKDNNNNLSVPVSIVIRVVDRESSVTNSNTAGTTVKNKLPEATVNLCGPALGSSRSGTTGTYSSVSADFSSHEFCSSSATLVGNEPNFPSQGGWVSWKCKKTNGNVEAPCIVLRNSVSN